jgi:hypothetical protein
MAFRVQGLLEFNHVPVLFRIDVLIREVDLQLINLELHFDVFDDLKIFQANRELSFCF